MNIFMRAFYAFGNFGIWLNKWQAKNREEQRKNPPKKVGLGSTLIAVMLIWGLVWFVQGLNTSSLMNTLGYMWELFLDGRLTW